MKSENTAEEARVTLRGIVGLRLLGSRNFCATRHFYFGGETSPTDPDSPHFTLGLDCPWRIRRAGLIVVGSDDYYEKADGNADPSWEPGMPSGHLQNQKLVELLGELKEARVITTHPGFVVKAVDLDECGGMRIGLEPDCILEVFPNSVKSMQWIFKSPDRPSLVLMNGVVNRTKKKSTGAEGEGGGTGQPELSD
jgi:hypothetical protein